MYGLIGLGIVVGMALIHDADGTIQLVTVAVSVRGITWLVKKLTGSINLDAAQIIDFTGWSIAGVSCIGVIKNAMNSVGAIKAQMAQIGTAWGNVVEVIDKIVFWN